MSVNSYLYNLSSELIITDQERQQIDGYLSNLRSRLATYFSVGQMAENFSFGSYTRKTLMPRKADSRSDVDHMIVFNPTKPPSSFYSDKTFYDPTTYLSWLRSFVETRYGRSEIYQSHPTIVLQLSNFKIELVPAKKDAFDKYEIPAPSSSYTQWMVTTPNAFNERVRLKNVAERSLIRPLIRLMKFWNSQNGYVYSSYELEQKIVNIYYNGCVTLWDYLRVFVSNLSTFGLGTDKTVRVERLKRVCSDAHKYETSIWLPGGGSAESEIQKAFPAFRR